MYWRKRRRSEHRFKYPEAVAAALEEGPERSPEQTLQVKCASLAADLIGAREGTQQAQACARCRIVIVDDLQDCTPSTLTP